MFAWQTAGRPTKRINMPSPIETCDVINPDNRDIFLLDVRKPGEVEKGGPVPGAINISLTELSQRTQELPREKEIYVFCGSGTRAMMGASLLERAGFEKISVPQGGIKGLKSVCPGF
jgi:hydroxyacylglutathione hydrolase